jgi:DNA polymerase III delta prime subunit
MKKIQLTCEEYCNYKEDLHNIKYNKYSQFESFENFKNLILYGPRGVGKYTQALQIIKKFSFSNLKYERKMSFEFNKEIYNFIITDIHIEIDLDMLGCHSKVLWHDIYTKYTDILISKQIKNGIILCKNFHTVHNELHDIFFSYINNVNSDVNIKFIIITENVSFIHNNILCDFDILSLSVPANSKLNKIFKKNYNINLKNVNYNINQKNNYSILCDVIINDIINIESFDIKKFRDHLYDLLIYNLNIYNCVWYIVYTLFNDKIYSKHNNDIVDKTISFLKLYNNNYRPIYHLENYFIYLLNIIHVNKPFENITTN